MLAPRSISLTCAVLTPLNPRLLHVSMSAVSTRGHHVAANLRIGERQDFNNW